MENGEIAASSTTTSTAGNERSLDSEMPPIPAMVRGSLLNKSETQEKPGELRQRRRPDERCPVLDEARNKHSKDSIAAMGDLASMRQQFAKFGSNGIQDNGLVCKAALETSPLSSSAGSTSAGSSSSNDPPVIVPRTKRSTNGVTLTPITPRISTARKSGTTGKASEVEEDGLAKIERAVTNKLERDFPKLPPIRSGDWLKEHSEIGQTFKSYMNRATSMNARPSRTRRTLYVQPLGAIEFASSGAEKKTKTFAKSGASADGTGPGAAPSVVAPTAIKSVPNTLKHISDSDKSQLLHNMQKLASPGTPFLTSMKSFLEAFFLGMDVKVLPYKAITDVTSRNNEWDGQHQLDAGEIINKHLPKLRMPLRDSYALLGVTMEDLYPRESWNFVFGLADMLGRNGVFSFARYDEPATLRNEDDEEITYRQARLLKRAVKVMAHELGHCFGLKHCVHFNCLMQGSNSGEEAERKPHFLCPVCLKKLYFSVEFDAEERYKALRQWCQNIVAEQKNPKHKEIYETVFGDWRDWYSRRIEAICPEAQ